MRVTIENESYEVKNVKCFLSGLDDSTAIAELSLTSFEGKKIIISIYDDVIEKLFKGIYSIETKDFNFKSAITHLANEKEILLIASGILKSRAELLKFEAKKIEKVANLL